MRVGIFGGSFNPPHKMNINIIKYLIDNNYIDKAIIVPTGINYQYKNDLESNNHRYNMLMLSTKDYANILVSDYEFKEKMVYTYQTLDYFKKLYFNDEIYFICGADNFNYIDSWACGKKILENYKIIVIKRDNYLVRDMLLKYEKYLSNIVVCNLSIDHISSTLIRDKIKNGELINDYVDSAVLKYIIDNNLYR